VIFADLYDQVESVASFPGSPRVQTKGFSVLQAMESWVGLGNEAIESAQQTHVSKGVELLG